MKVSVWSLWKYFSTLRCSSNHPPSHFILTQGRSRSCYVHKSRGSPSPHRHRDSSENHWLVLLITASEEGAWARPRPALCVLLTHRGGSRVSTRVLWGTWRGKVPGASARDRCGFNMIKSYLRASNDKVLPLTPNKMLSYAPPLLII